MLADDLGFEKFKHIVAESAISKAAKEKTLTISPFQNISEIHVLQEQITSIRNLIDLGENPPLENFIDIREELVRCKIVGAFLAIESLQYTNSILKQAHNIRAFFKKNRGGLSPLTLLSKGLSPIYQIQKLINSILTKEGKIQDNASPKLREIRKSIKNAMAQLHKEISRTMEKAKKENWLQEDNPTIRNGRLVLPLRAENKRKIHGIIHGESATGSTAYVEPLIMVEINNRLKELEADEKKEVSKILEKVTSEIRPYFPSLEQNIVILTEIDFIKACAQTSRRFQCNPPIISDDDSQIKLIKARHPLLSLIKEVIPLDIALPSKIRTLIITGPNAGGKTVAMKTVGLLSKIAMCGLHIPAEPDSRLPFFDNFLVDIGDQQSIEDDLSTFSSHVSNLKRFIEQSTKRSLVLIDELGTGTDPIEGSTLGQATLEELIHVGALTIATTHHSSLKAFADKNKNVINGAMEFNTDSLTPSYKFRVGLPGSSYALEIANRLGVPASVIDRARQLIGRDQVKLENLLMEVEEIKTKIEKEKSEVDQNKKTLDKLVTEYEIKVDSIKEKHKRMDDQLSLELHKLLKESRANIEKTVKEIREKEASKQSITSARDSVKKLEREVINRKSKKEKRVSEKAEKNQPEIGNWVKIDSLKKEGQIVNISPKSSRIAVDIDGKTLWVAKNSIKIIEPIDIDPSQKSSVSMNIETTVSSQLDLRGMRYDIAEDTLIRYLDRAMLAGLNEVEIIHGKGTGALQKMTHEVLKKYPGIDKYYFENFDSGGTGATMIKF